MTTLLLSKPGCGMTVTSRASHNEVQRERNLNANEFIGADGRGTLARTAMTVVGRSSREFAVLLLQRRVAAGLSQEELAERAGLSRRGISDLERGARRAPHPATVRRLAQGLGLRGADRSAFIESTRHSAAPPATSATRIHRSVLTAPTSSFVGRHRELGELRQLLGQTRLLTLVGSAGVGKTRLALQLAQPSPGDTGDVILVDLTALTEPGLVPGTVAAVIGLEEQPGRSPTQGLIDVLKDRAVLVVLDNCEHLIQACAELVDSLLRGCPRLRVLATSRRALRVAGEKVWRVPSLELPMPGGPDALAQTAHIEAVELFVERARAVVANFALTEKNAAAVASICHQLDGVPLALELAAARTTVLTVDQIADRLSDRFALLTGGSRTAMPRQQTLRAALDWSYDLLSAQQRTLLRRLSVFSGGWTLDAAATVCVGDELSFDDIMDLLDALVDSSLVLADLDARGSMRYRLLESVRQYANEKLAEENAAVAELREQHARFYLAVAEQGDAELRGPKQVDWLDRLEVEHENLRAALTWTQAAGAIELRLRLSGALAWFWRLRSHFSEGRRWLRLALSASTDQAISDALAAPMVKALVGAGLLAFAEGDGVESRRLLQHALELAQQQGDTAGVGWAFHGLARTAQDQREYAETIRFAESSLTAFRAIGDQIGIAYSLYYLGRGLAGLPDLESAWTVGEESTTLFRTLGDSWGLLWVLLHLSATAMDSGQHQRSDSLCREALGLSQRVGTTWGIRNSVICLARVAEAHAQPQRAARLLGAADALSARVGMALGPHDRSRVAQLIARLRVQLGEATFGAAWNEGRTFSITDLVAYALGEASHAVPDAAAVLASSSVEPGAARCGPDRLADRG